MSLNIIETCQGRECECDHGTDGLEPSDDGVSWLPCNNQANPYQEDFTKAYLGLQAQGFIRAKRPSGVCVLLTDEGLRCAIGHLVDDAEIDQKTNKQANLLLSDGFYCDLQGAHDSGVTPAEMQVLLLEVAKQYDLVVPDPTHYQTHFDRIYLGLASQGFVRVLGTLNHEVLLALDGRRGALGWLVDDAEPDRGFSDQAWALWKHTFYRDLDRAYSYGTSPDQMQRLLHRVAAEYRLTVPEVTQ